MPLNYLPLITTIAVMNRGDCYLSVLKSENIKSDIDNLSEMTNVKKKRRIYLTLSFIVSKISILSQIYR